MAVDWKQGKTYEDPSKVQEAEVEEPAATEDEESSEKKGGFHIPKKGVPYAIGLVAIIVTIALVALFGVFNKGTMETPGTADPEIIDPVAEDPGFLDEYVIQFQYTKEEREQLRAWGYTGSEIEDYQLEQTPAADLIAKAKEAQEQARATLANPESPEYQNLLNQTWLGEPAVTPPYVGADTPYTITQRRENCDYVKCEPHGTNLMLKVELPSGTHHFMEVSIVQWSRLNDRGNIVVDYQEIEYEGKVFITNMHEVEV